LLVAYPFIISFMLYQSCVGFFCRAAKVIGYKPPELLGKSVFDFFHPEDQAHMRDSFEQGRQVGS